MRCAVPAVCQCLQQCSTVWIKIKHWVRIFLVSFTVSFYLHQEAVYWYLHLLSAQYHCISPHSRRGSCQSNHISIYGFGICCFSMAADKQIASLTFIETTKYYSHAEEKQFVKMHLSKRHIKMVLLFSSTVQCGWATCVRFAKPKGFSSDLQTPLLSSSVIHRCRNHTPTTVNVWHVSTIERWGSTESHLQISKHYYWIQHTAHFLKILL